MTAEAQRPTAHQAAGVVRAPLHPHDRLSVHRKSVERLHPAAAQLPRVPHLDGPVRSTWVVDTPVPIMAWSYWICHAKVLAICSRQAMLCDFTCGNHVVSQAAPVDGVKVVLPVRLQVQQSLFRCFSKLV